MVLTLLLAAISSLSSRTTVQLGGSTPFVRFAHASPLPLDWTARHGDENIAGGFSILIKET